MTVPGMLNRLSGLNETKLTASNKRYDVSITTSYAIGDWMDIGQWVNESMGYNDSQRDSNVGATTTSHDQWGFPGLRRSVLTDLFKNRRHILDNVSSA
jgi:hypothetical protein